MANLPCGLGKGLICIVLAMNTLSVSLLEMIGVLCSRWFGSPVLKYLELCAESRRKWEESLLLLRVFHVPDIILI